MNIVKRDEIVSLKKVLIFGEDKSGKSTFAEKYCKDNGLNPVVIDLENTNYSNLPLILDVDLSSDVKAYRQLKKLLMEISASEYDTVIIDGVDSLIEAFVSDANGLKAYSDRSKTYGRFIRDLDKSNLNVIFVGQAPLDFDWYKGDENPNKCIVRTNARVNEKYKCYVDEKGKFKVDTLIIRE